MKKIKKQSTTSRPHLQKIPWVFPRIPRRRTRTGSEIEPEEPPRPSKIPKSPFSLPPPSHSSEPFLKLLRSRPPLEKTPKTFWIRRLFKTLFKVEPDKPVRMPRFPTLRFPPLYTRFAIMKTYTAVSDANGKITVTFPRVFRKIPGVVISPKDAGTWFEHILSTNEFGFTVQILKTAHAHQHANSGGGGGHDHTHPNSGGGGGHDHTHPNSGGGGGHHHSTGNSNYEGNHWHYTDDKGGHDHTIGTGGGTKTSGVTGTYVSGGLIADGGAQMAYLHEYSAGCADPPDCYISWVITGINDGLDLTTKNHTHTTNINHPHSESTEPDHYHDTDWDGGHTHTIPNTNTEPNHQHTVPNSNTEPNHQHTVPNSNTEPNHDHPVPDSNEKEASLLANTSVTFTYFAQEES